MTIDIIPSRAGVRWVLRLGWDVVATGLAGTIAQARADADGARRRAWAKAWTHGGEGWIHPDGED